MAAIPVVQRVSGRPVILVGGLAVMCRLSVAYRATADLDGVDYRRVDQSSQLELLIAGGAVPNGPSGVIVQTDRGAVPVDILGITDADMGGQLDDPTDRLYLDSHVWAVRSASPLFVAVEDALPERITVAEPGPLIAMKLQSIRDRHEAKAATDLLDIVRLVMDRRTRSTALEQLASASDQVRSDAAFHVRSWFFDEVDRTFLRIRRLPEGQAHDRDDLDLIGELLLQALEG